MEDMRASPAAVAKARQRRSSSAPEVAFGPQGKKSSAAVASCWMVRAKFFFTAGAATAAGAAAVPQDISRPLGSCLQSSMCVGTVVLFVLCRALNMRFFCGAPSLRLVCTKTKPKKGRRLANATRATTAVNRTLLNALSRFLRCTSPLPCPPQISSFRFLKQEETG